MWWFDSNKTKPNKTKNQAPSFLQIYKNGLHLCYNSYMVSKKKLSDKKVQEIRTEDWDRHDSTELIVPDGNSARKGVRQEDTGETSPSNDWPSLYCLERPFTPF